MEEESAIFPLLESIPVSDHFYRAIFFLNNCRQSPDILGYNWNILASIYSARAIVEIVDHQLKKGILGLDPDTFWEGARSSVRRFRLIETIRVQDFHRTPVRFDPNVQSFLGPAVVRSSTQAGSGGGLSVDPETGKPVVHKTRNASVKQDRPLATSGLLAHDYDLDEMIQIDVALEQYLRDLKDYLCSYHGCFYASLHMFFTDAEQRHQQANDTQDQVR